VIRAVARWTPPKTQCAVSTGSMMARSKAGKPVAAVDLALHLGEVLYGNVGAVDRLDFTVIGPAVNEVARIETLCEPLGRRVLVSAEPLSK
jgi:class 3 adenylate cyclase